MVIQDHYINTQSSNDNMESGSDTGFMNILHFDLPGRSRERNPYNCDNNNYRRRTFTNYNRNPYSTSRVTSGINAQGNYYVSNGNSYFYINQDGSSYCKYANGYHHYTSRKKYFQNKTRSKKQRKYYYAF